VAEFGKTVTFTRGQHLYLPEYLVTDPSVYLLLDGEVQLIHKYNPLQKEVFAYRKGDLVGLLELYTGGNRITSADAVTDVHAVAFTRENFEKAMISNLNFALGAIRILSKMLRQINQKIKALG